MVNSLCLTLSLLLFLCSTELVVLTKGGETNSKGCALPVFLAALSLMELAVPNGVDAETCVEQFLGTLPTAHEDMPDEADVDATAFIKLK